MTDQTDYRTITQGWEYAYGQPLCSGLIKTHPSDFIVTEAMGIKPSGEGEHVWLDISKTRLSTDRVAKSLARYAGVAYKDVGYAGMKDVQAQTRQWFSVWLPGQADLDWSNWQMDGVEVHSVKKHGRKLRRGAHQGNHFELCVRDIEGDTVDALARAERVINQGVPNYFGDQRFGHKANNLVKAKDFFRQNKRIKDRNLKGILLSSARSFLFNQVVSERVRGGTWTTLRDNEPAALQGSNSVFNSADEADNQARLDALDIHPTAPLWGCGAAEATEKYTDLADWENEIIAPYSEFLLGLEKHGLEYSRRTLRCVPDNLRYQVQDNQLLLSFSLPAGQYATSVVRELLQLRSRAS